MHPQTPPKCTPIPQKALTLSPKVDECKPLAGGLAAHYHFGARRGSAVAFLGLCKLVLGLAFGGSLLTLLREFPAPVLGVMLATAWPSTASPFGLIPSHRSCPSKLLTHPRT